MIDIEIYVNINTRSSGWANNYSRPTLACHCSTHCSGFKAFQPSRLNPKLAILMGVMRKHDLTNKKTKTKANTKTMTMTNTFK